MKHTSPGAYFREMDFSLYAANLSTTMVGFVGTATKGPVNEPTLVTNVPQFQKIFGFTSPSHYMPYAVLEYLRRGKIAMVVRIAGTEAVAAKASFNAYTPANVVSTDVDQSFTISSTTNNLRVVVTDERTDPVTTYDGTVTLTAATYATPALMATEIANKLARNPMLSQVATAISHGSKVKLVALVSSPLVKIRVAAASTNDAATALGLPVGALADASAFTVTPQGTPGTTTVSYSIVAKNGTGRSVATAQTTTSAATLTGTNFNRLAFTLPTGTASFDVYRTSGTTVKIASDLAAGVSQYDDVGTIALGSGTTATLPTDSESVGVLAGTFQIEASSPGTYGNYISVQILQRSAFRFDFNVYEGSPRNTAGYVTEPLRNLSLDDSTTRWIGTVLGTESTVGQSTAVRFVTATPDTIPTADSLVVPEAKTTTLSGGDDGLASVIAADYIGINTPVRTGLQLFRDPKHIDINLLCVPGISTPSVLNELLAISEERGDCMAILDTPDNYTAQQVVDWHNGVGAFADHQSFNSSYGAMYWPWVEIYDSTNGIDVWVPPSGHVAAVYAYTDFIAETWFAPAGLNRGHIVAANRVRYNASDGEIEFMYGGSQQNAINPIVQFPKDGITVWGQRTLQRAPTARDRVNVRRLLLYMRKVLATAVKYLIFEPNDQATWRQFFRLVNPFMASIQAGRGVYAYQIICDASTNPPDQIDNNEMGARVYIQPTKAAEIINVDFVITPTGARFTDFAELIF